MSMIKVNYFSNALSMQSDFYAIIPQNNTAGEIGNIKEGSGTKNLLLLHGLSDDETIWMRRTSIERYADRYGINVIIPFGARSFYTDMKYGGNYYTQIAKEIPLFAQNLLNIPEGRDNWYVAGLSMGGYGALKIALKENEFFAGGAALSPVTDLNNPIFPETLIPVFGEPLTIPSDEDLFSLTKQYSGRKNNPRLLTIDGFSDFMYDDYLRFLKNMENLQYDFSHYEYEGAHTWEFWDEHIVDIIEWIKKDK